MKKKQLLEVLAEFDDDDHIMLGDVAERFPPRITKICGGRQKYMGYYCVLQKGHDGPCWCQNKDVDFEGEIFD